MNHVVKIQPNCSNAFSFFALRRSTTFQKWPTVIWMAPIRKQKPMMFCAERLGSVRKGI